VVPILCRVMPIVVVSDAYRHQLLKEPDPTFLVEPPRASAIWVQGPGEGVRLTNLIIATQVNLLIPPNRVYLCSSTYLQLLTGTCSGNRACQFHVSPFFFLVSAWTRLA